MNITPANEAYWLRYCHGFRVESEDGSVGIVEDVLYEGGAAWPAVLVVRSGLFRLRAQLVAVEDVAHVAPRTKRIVVRRSTSRPLTRCERSADVPYRGAAVA